jgi:RND family efflux transporter MFP subunit
MKAYLNLPKSQNVLVLLGLLFSLPLSVQASPDWLSADDVSCLLEPSVEVDISSETDGVVSRVYVDRGDKVQKGQNLLSLHSGVQQAILASANAKVEFANRKVTRNQDLFDKGLLSEHERDEMLTEKRLAELALQESAARLNQRTVKSPITGIVVKKDISPGEYIDEKPVLKLVKLQLLHAEVVIPSRFYGRVIVGQELFVSVLNDLNEKHSAIVKIVDPVIDAASDTFAVQLIVENKEGFLPAGLKCQLSQ